MKRTLLTFSVLLASAVATSAMAADLAGTWNFSAGSCLSGAAVNSAAVFPKMTIVMTASEMTFTQEADGCTVVVGPFAMTATADKITPAKTQHAEMVCTDGYKESGDGEFISETSYTVDQKKLSIIIGPLAADSDTCTMGDSTVFSFDRVP